MAPRLLDEGEVRSLVGPPEAMAAVEEGFRALATGRASPPGIMHLDPPGGEIHVKGGHIQGQPCIAIKVATGFMENPKKGLPTAGGLFLALDSSTGLLRWVLLDNGFLTDLRTGAAGAVAARYMAPVAVDTVGVFGSGTQARYQVEALLQVRRFRRLLVHGRTGASVQAYAKEMATRLGLEVEVTSPEEVVGRAQVVITATASDKPLVKASWLHPGLHITAVGSDAPWKQELEPEVLAAADLVVVDHLDQCRRLGELHHAIASGLLGPEDVHGTLGEVIAGKVPGRTADAQVTVTDLTGVGVQDTAIANEVCRRAEAKGLGRPLGGL